MKKKIRWPLYVIAALIVTFLAFVVPLPYYIEVPGGSEDIRQVLKVNDTEDKEAGAYHFVTVGVQHATLAHMIYAWLTPFTDIRSAQETTGGSSDVEFMRINQFYMQTSQNMAKYQGLKTAGKDIELKYLGVYVLTVTDNSTFKGILNISDTVTAVNDQTFDSSKDLIDYVNSQKLGDSVKVTYEEDGQTKSAEGKITVSYTHLDVYKRQIMVTMMIAIPKPRPLSVAKYLIASAIGAPIVFQINPIGFPVALSTLTQPVKTSNIATPIAESAKRLIDFTVFIPSLKIIPFYSTVFLQNIQ